MYVKELDSLRDQNMKLAENTKMIEERYKEVSELAKRALKPAALAKESPISIEDSAEARREAAAQKRSPKVGHKPPQSVALVEPSDELHGRGESTKTLPKKPPLKAAKEKTKKKVPKSIPAISDRMEPSPPLCELKPNSASRRDHKPPAEAPGQKPGGRYLLPRRGRLD